MKIKQVTRMAPMEPIRHFCISRGKKTLIARDNFTVAFFSTGDYKNIAEGVPKVFERWLNTVPKEAIKLAKVGSSGTAECKPVKKNTLSKIRAQIESGRALEKNHVWVYIRSEDFCPDYSLKISADDYDTADFVEMLFPSEFPSNFGYDRFTKLVMDFAIDLGGYSSGYASPSIYIDDIYGDESRADVGKVLFPLLWRHPGYDISDNEVVRLQGNCRGAYWLTFLGSFLVTKLEGKESLARKLKSSKITIESAGKGVVIRAGDRPEIGDTERGEKPLLLRSVSSAIESIICTTNSASIKPYVPWKERHEWAKKWALRHLE